MVPILFIQRDNVLIKKPTKWDTPASFTLIPGVIQSLKRICDQTDYELVLITDQEAIGTQDVLGDKAEAFQELLIRILQGEGIAFSAIHANSWLVDKVICSTDELATYIQNPNYDMHGSLVIGNKKSDVALAKRLSCGALLLQQPAYQVSAAIGPTLSAQLSADSADDRGVDPESSSASAPKTVMSKIPKKLQPSVIGTVNSWLEVANMLTKQSELPPRMATIGRRTKETAISLVLNLDGTGQGSVDTGIPFFDHMLDQLIRHGQFDMQLKVKGDLEIDAHHTVEDTAIVLGEAFAKALDDKKGANRYGAWLPEDERYRSMGLIATLPMDEAKAEVLVDFCSRPWVEYDLAMSKTLGGIEPEMWEHFFKSFAYAAGCTLHISGRGRNGHHKIEIVFKAFAHALKRGVRRNTNDLRILTTKGSL